MAYAFRNAVYNKWGTIDCEINHPQFGWIPFTADPNDVEAHGRDIYASALAATPAAYVEPEALVVEELTPQQARATLAAAIGYTTEEIDALFIAAAKGA